MSPASSGPLEVERYIGACLISSHGRTKAQNPGIKSRDVYYPPEAYMHDLYPGYVTLDARYRPRRCNSVDGWAGGMPLISFANNRRNRRPDDSSRCGSPRVEDVQQHMPLSRLAVHTQGLPLILSGRQGNRRSKTPRVTGPQIRVIDKKIVGDKDSINGVDSLSIASDESSGSNGSETSLPRIIKPRKRRKKDRKPHPVRSPLESPEPIQESDIFPTSPYIPYCYERYVRIHPPRSNQFNNKSISERNSEEPKTDLSSETPQLHHRFEDVIGAVDDDSGEPSSCQCKYCDPAGQIWDVGKHCYSPFLTTPTFIKHLRQPDDRDTSDVSWISPNKHPPSQLSDRISASLINRHCYSPVPTTNTIQPDADTNVSLRNPATHPQPQLSDRISAALKNQCLISKLSLNVEDAKRHSETAKQCLEISTKIVTSPNGHRDLEIRLFSTPIDDRPYLKNDKCDEFKFDQNLLPEE